MQDKITLRDFVKKLKKILWDDDFDIVEVIGVCYCSLWAVWFLTHPNLFSISSIYTSLGILGDERVWAAGFFFMAALKLYGIYIDKFRVRKWIALFVTSVWLFVLYTFIQENPGALLVAITGFQAATSIWEFLRHARHQEDRAAAKAFVKEEISNI